MIKNQVFCFVRQCLSSASNFRFFSTDKDLPSNTIANSFEVVLVVTSVVDASAARYTLHSLVVAADYLFGSSLHRRMMRMHVQHPTELIPRSFANRPPLSFVHQRMHGASAEAVSVTSHACRSCVGMPTAPPPSLPSLVRAVQQLQLQQQSRHPARGMLNEHVRPRPAQEKLL